VVLPNPALQTLLDPRRLLRRIYVARLCVATAIFVAAVLVWQRVPASDTLIASLAFAATLTFTAGSVAYTEMARRPVGTAFRYGQSLFDLLLVTTVVHVTGGSSSQFTALYIPAIASAALLLPTGAGLLVALLGCTVYFADVFALQPTPVEPGVILQLAVFGAVAAGSGWISARLREAGAGSAELAEELAKVRLQADDILRNIRSGIISVDPAGKLLFANHAAEQLLGVTLAGREGQPIVDELAARAPELAQSLRRTAREGVRTTRREGTVTLADRTFPIGVTTTLTQTTPDRDGKAAAGAGNATAIFQDISDNKRLETLHMRAERSEAIAELAASLAHEIKNPLAAVRSAVEQIARRPSLDDDERTLTTLIVRESDRLSRLLSEFLDFARVRVARFESVDLGQVARDACSLASEHPSRQAGVEVVCPAPSAPLLVEGDPDLLHRVLFNLTLNAVQATPAGGQVMVEVAAAQANDALPSGLAFDSGGVAVRVSDTGGGIPVDIRDRLFDPFITTKPGGSGLGLAIVQRAVDAHRGLVFVDSSSTGTRFTVLLPTTQQDAQLS
jgi:two-component system sensor histidine kinase PilS (NtrC family)